jgi:hypothetical protein
VVVGIIDFTDEEPEIKGQRQDDKKGKHYFFKIHIG